MLDSRFYINSGPKPIGELVAGLSVSVPDGVENVPISELLDLEASTPGALGFLMSRKFKGALDTAKAAACLLPEELAPAAEAKGIIPLITAHPRGHFARIISRMVSKIPLEMEGPAQIARSAFVHPLAIIGAGAKIGDDVYIGPYCIVGPGVEIGARTRLETHIIAECAVIGSDSLFKSGARIGTEGFGIDADEKGILNLPHIGAIRIGSHVRVGANSCIDRGFLGNTIIGDHVKIDNQVQIAHNCTIGEGTMIAAHTGISGSCQVGKYVKMGGAVGLADHISVGDGAQLAAAAGVMHNVPAGEIWSGVPAMPIRDHMRMVSATRKLIQKKPKS